jgi:hypothetical protein
MLPARFETFVYEDKSTDCEAAARMSGSFLSLEESRDSMI